MWSDEFEGKRSRIEVTSLVYLKVVETRHVASVPDDMFKNLVIGQGNRRFPNRLQYMHRAMYMPARGGAK